MVQLVMSCTFFFAYKHLTQRWQQATHSLMRILIEGDEK